MGDEIPDFILVVKEYQLPSIDLYLENLKVLGLDVQNEKGKTLDYIFIKVYITEDALKHFSQLYDIGNEDAWVTPSFYTDPIFSTPFNNPIAGNAQLQKGEITGANKIMIVSKVLENAKYGENDKDFGLAKLISLKIIHTAYPLHDGPITASGTNTRSLLNNYWSNASVAHMQQPLDLIHAYFGTEVAFYFAWLEYFNIMLAIPAVLGAVTFLGSLIRLVVEKPVQVAEICENRNAVMCPTCEDHKGCKFSSLTKYCGLAQWSYVFDNNLSIIFAILISFWVTLFLKLWRRKEYKLKIRWNCVNDVRETQIRQSYLDGAKHYCTNRITGEAEPYTPKLILFFRYTIICAVCFFMFGIVILIVMLNMNLKILFTRFCDTTDNTYLRTNSKLLTMTMGSLVQVIVMKCFENLYKPFSMILTNFENPKTQSDFDNSVLYKRYLLACANNYIPCIYTAFIKGRFVTMPHKMSYLKHDSCQPLHCAMALCVQLTFVMTVKTLIGNLLSLVVPLIKDFFRKLIYFKGFNKDQQQTSKTAKNVPQWEQEYHLEPLKRYSVTKEFSEMIIRYGHVSFFSEAFPLAALCALVNNLLELRSDAYKFVASHRRPVPVPKSGIGAWNGILRSLSYLSAAMNGFVIAFTSDWVSRELYRQNEENGSLVGYVNSTLSKYATADHKAYGLIKNAPEFCYFRGRRYPPDSPLKYEKTPNYWMDLTFRFVAVFVFEHIMLMSVIILGYCIPFMPDSVKSQFNLSNEKKKEARLAECQKKMNNTKIDVNIVKKKITKSLRTDSGLGWPNVRNIQQQKTIDTPTEFLYSGSTDDDDDYLTKRIQSSNKRTNDRCKSAGGIFMLSSNAKISI